MAWPLFLLYDFVWFVDIPSLCQKQPSAFHYGKWKRPLWEEDWVLFVDILSLFRKQPSAFHYGKWKRSLWEEDWVCFHIAVSIGIIPSTLQCKSIKIKHILLIDSRARVVWCLLCLRSIYIPWILFRWLTKASKENAPLFVYWLAYTLANCFNDEKLPFLIVYSCFWLYFICDT